MGSQDPPIHSYKMKLSVVLVVVALVGMAICEPEPLFKKKGKGGYKGGYGHGIQPSYQHHYYQQQPYYYGYYKAPKKDIFKEIKDFIFKGKKGHGSYTYPTYPRYPPTHRPWTYPTTKKPVTYPPPLYGAPPPPARPQPVYQSTYGKK